MKKVFPKRDNQSNKGDFNKVLIYAGSNSFPGATLLCCRSALFSGVGQVILANNELRNSLYTVLPEVTYMSRGFKSKQDCDKKITSILFGNGLDYPNKDITKDFTILMHEFNGRLIIDATGLKYLFDYLKGENLVFTPEIILTPHLKEFCDLVSIPLTSKDVLDYEKYMDTFLEKIPRCTLVLKGYSTLIKTRKIRYYFNHPNSGLSHAGTGDVLAGFIAGVAAYSRSFSSDICYCSVYIMNQAAKLEEKKIPSSCLKASCIIDSIPAILKNYIN